MLAFTGGRYLACASDILTGPRFESDTPGSPAVLGGTLPVPMFY
jgi:hypothetical protein